MTGGCSLLGSLWAGSLAFLAAALPWPVFRFRFEAAAGAAAGAAVLRAAQMTLLASHLAPFDASASCLAGRA